MACGAAAGGDLDEEELAELEMMGKGMGKGPPGMGKGMGGVASAMMGAGVGACQPGGQLAVMPGSQPLGSTAPSGEMGGGMGLGAEAMGMMACMGGMGPMGGMPGMPGMMGVGAMAGMPGMGMPG